MRRADEIRGLSSCISNTLGSFVATQIPSGPAQFIIPPLEFPRSITTQAKNTTKRDDGDDAPHPWPDSHCRYAPLGDIIDVLIARPARNGNKDRWWDILRNIGERGRRTRVTERRTLALCRVRHRVKKLSEEEHQINWQCDTSIRAAT